MSKSRQQKVRNRKRRIERRLRARNCLFPRVPRWEAIRTGRFKYIRYPDLGREFDELYDLQADPFELKNLALDPSAAHRRESLSGQLEKGFEDLAQ